MSVKALVDYDGWMRVEQWQMTKDEAIARAYRAVRDKDSRIIKIMLFQGTWPFWSMTNWKKEYSCNI